MCVLEAKVLFSIFYTYFAMPVQFLVYPELLPFLLVL